MNNNIQQLKEFLKINLNSNINTEHEEALYRIDTLDNLLAENGKLREIDSEPKLHIHALNITIADKDAEIENLIHALTLSNNCLDEWLCKGGAKNTLSILTSSLELIKELE